MRKMCVIGTAPARQRADAAPICTTGWWRWPECRRSLVASSAVRVLLRSAKHLFFAAKPPLARAGLGTDVRWPKPGTVG